MLVYSALVGPCPPGIYCLNFPKVHIRVLQAGVNTCSRCRVT